MLLQKLSLQNFRCFEKLDLEFKDRLNLFLGDNGSGKSAILDAIAVGLGPVATYLPDVAGVSFKDDDLKVVGGAKAPFVRVAVQSRPEYRFRKPWRYHRADAGRHRKRIDAPPMRLIG